MMNRAPTTLTRLLAAFAAAWLLAAATFAQANGRVALLIGNIKYPSSPLRNSINDVRDLGAALRDLGFKTIVKEDVTRVEMFAAIQEFGKAIEGADAAVFFYAGHAMQFKERNYLIPIDAVMGSEDDVTFFSIDVNQVFDRMERAKTRFNFVILDACRDNPFRDTFRVSASGLAQMGGPSGTLIAYATAPGATAQDGYNRNGTYTSHILQNIKIPDMPVEVLFRKVREGVERETKRTQTPWELSSIKGEFTFNASGRGAAGAATASSGPSAETSAQMELLFWKSVGESTRADDLQAYIDKYPNGTFTAIARNRMDALLGRTRPGPASTVAAASPAPAMTPAQAPTQAQVPATAASSAPATSSASPAASARPAASVAAAAPVVDPPKPAAEPPAKVAAAPVTAPPAAKPPAPAVEPGPGATSGPAETPVLSPPRRDEQPGREIAPGIREVKFNDGSVYTGAMRGLQLHGKGTYSSKAFKYEGEYKDGAMQGQGVSNWENGDRYEGEFAADRPNGKGRYQFGNGDSYDGEVKAGVINGRGMYLTKAGDRIEGSFVDGKATGVGIYRFTSGDRYEGEMAGGRLQGKGRYFMKSGDRIEGTFVNGLAQGKGAYHFANGDRYEGDLQDGIMSGTGTYYYQSSGSKYEGEFVAGVLKGKGTFWFPDGSRFEGVFENGMSRARGESVATDGKRVPAELVDGLVRNLGS